MISGDRSHNKTGLAYGLAFILLLLGGCSNNGIKIDHGEQLAPLPLYNRNKYDSSVTPGKFIKDVQVIKLKSSADPSSIIAEAARVFFINNKYYIWDQKFSGIKVFDAEGNYLFQLGRIGKGPGEYVRIFDFQIVDSSRIILLCDAIKLEYFDLSGNYLKTTSLGMFATNFSTVGSGKFLFYIANSFSSKSENSNLILTDTNINVLHRHFESNTKDKNDWALFAYTGFLTNGAGGGLFSLAFDDKIYSVSDTGLHVKYKFDFGSKKLPEEIVYNNSRSKAKEWHSSTYIGNQLFEDNKYLFFSFLNGNRIEYGIVDLQTKHVNVQSNIETTDDYWGRLLYVPLGGTTQTIIVGLPPERIMYLKDKQKDYVETLKNRSPQLYDMIRSYQLTDNLVLLKCSID